MSLPMSVLVLGLCLATVASDVSFAGLNSLYSPPSINTAGYRCGDGFVRKIDGSCVRPIIKKSIFLFDAPKFKVKYQPPPRIPAPAIDYNYVFIKAPDPVTAPQAVVVPPPQQKTLVYVLNKQLGQQQQEVIEVPSEVSAPEVYFINYNEGENPTLPGGIDLQTALSQSAHAGHIVGQSGGENLASSGIHLGGTGSIVHSSSSHGFGGGSIDLSGSTVLNENSFDFSGSNGFGGNAVDFGSVVGSGGSLVSLGGSAGFGGSLLTTGGSSGVTFNQGLDLGGLGGSDSLSSFDDSLSSSYGVPPSTSNLLSLGLSTAYGPPPLPLENAGTSLFVKDVSASSSKV
ncbi:ATP-dependent RNA helicase A [Hyalella azteca]|uniref:ATP-dependent RNA helicase A n=1 Tax=Hyalella azteca TaxID=294128 RepID=A0A8B7PPY0_HYAAZ|nr:ATP-dependent RNA helicase A [Hyalella azteca]